MRKMLMGLLVLAVIFSATLVNNVYLNLEISAIKKELQDAFSLDGEEASAAVKRGYERWESTRTYRNIILRENKCETISEGFIACLTEPEEEGLKENLLFQLDSLIEGEKISIETIF